VGETGGKVETGRERALIEAALAAATPAPGGWLPPPAESPLPPAGSFEGYEVVREIHRGGQGVVYLAVQASTKRKVAIKVMHAGPFLGSSGKARFEREVEVLGQLHHPNIVDIHDSGQTADGSFYYVMDYISGRSLDEALESQKERPPIAETLALFAKICDGINAAHLRGIIHRDLKPSNIRIDPSGEPVIVDFGLAKVGLASVTSESTPRLMTMTGEFIGSLPWASPEQAVGSAGGLDVRTDVYSLGVILYQMLTGKFPYQVIGNMRDVLDNIIRAEPARPSTIRRQINDEVETLVLKCLSKDKERRYQSAGDVARDIRRYLAGEPIEAKRDSGWYVLTKTLNRYRAPVGAGAAFLVMLVAFAVGMTVMYRQADAARAGEAAAAAVAREAQQEAEELRDHAQDNFEQTWKLASSLGFEVFDLIKNLRGATEAKSVLLNEITAALDAISVDERADDPAFQRDYARALGRLGVLLGGRSLHRAADSGRAQELVDRSAQILERLRAASPDDHEVASALGEARRRQAYMARSASKWAEAEEYHRQAMDLHNEAAGARTATAEQRAEARRERAAALIEFGDLYAAWIDGKQAGGTAEAERLHTQMGLRYNEAAVYWDGRLAEDPQDEEAARWNGTLLLKRAREARLSGRMHLGEAETPEDGVDLEAARRREIARQERLAALTPLGRALELCEQALGAFEPLAAASGASGEAARDILTVHNEIGTIQVFTARALRLLAEMAEDEAEAEAFRVRAEEAVARGRAASEAAVEAAERLADSDESNLIARRELAVALLTLASHGGGAAEANLRRSLAIREDLARSDPLPQYERDVAVAHYQLAAHLEREGDGLAGAERAERYRAALDHLRQALQRLEGGGHGGGDTVRNAIQRVEGKLQ
jgi:predicted Ser/Thr protein kinase